MKTLSGKIVLFLFCFFFILCSPAPKKQRDAGPATADGDQNPVRVGARKEIFETGKVLPKVTCKTNPSLSFALYLPSSYDTSKKFPVIIFFDPHGAGEFVVTKYHRLAEEFEVMLMGSNDSKNGLSFDQTNQIAKTLAEEASERFSIEKEITLAGFSGGARAALSFAMSDPTVSSVIYCSAAMPLQKSARVFSLLGFAGTGDMNYTEVVNFDQSLQNSSYNHFLIEWNGKHEWPDSATFGDAFFFNYIMRRGEYFQPAENSQNDQVQHFIKSHPVPEFSKHPLEAAQVLEELIFLVPLPENVTHYRKLLDSVKQMPAYTTALNDKQHVIQQESAIKKQYIDDFQSKDLNWWKNEIARMNAVKDPQQKPMYQRLLGFISLAGYSLSNKAIRQDNFTTAEKMLAIYKLADPKNSDQPFLEACMYAKQGKEDEALQSLHHAIDLGLNDPEKILNEPALASLRQNEKLQSLVSKMK